VRQIRKRLTYANVMSSIAVFLVIGGGAAFAATSLPKNSVGSPQIKKNAVKTGDIAAKAVKVGKLAPEAVKGGKLAKNAVSTNRIRKNAVTGAKVKESTLGEVPSASSATNATNADNVATVRTFSQGAGNESMVSLVKTANFELMGICSPNGTFDPPGVQSENIETSYVIYNRSAVPAFAGTDDDNDYNLTLNQGVIFNYQDNGDGGEAMSVDGHFMAVASWANLLGDTTYVDEPEASDDYPFPTTCHFAGAALVG